MVKHKKFVFKNRPKNWCYRPRGAQNYFQKNAIFYIVRHRYVWRKQLFIFYCLFHSNKIIVYLTILSTKTFKVYSQVSHLVSE
jgi:hypothetical protein